MKEEKKGIGEKIKNLEQSIDWFYSEEFKLEEAATKYEEAIREAKSIEKDLNELKNKIEVLEKDFTKE